MWENTPARCTGSSTLGSGSDWEGTMGQCAATCQQLGIIFEDALPSSLMARISALRQPFENPKLKTAPPIRRPSPSAPPRRRSPSAPFSLNAVRSPFGIISLISLAYSLTCRMSNTTAASEMQTTVQVAASSSVQWSD